MDSDPNSYKLVVASQGDCTAQISANGETVIWRAEKEIGGGGFGRVRLEKAVVGEVEYLRAVKRIIRNSVVDTALYLEREVKALIAVQEHLDLFVQFFGWYEDDSLFSIAMEYAPLGDLGGYIETNEVALLQSNSAQITRQLLKALVVLHEQNIYHRDLKPPNVLVMSHVPIHVKLADFGASKSTINTMLKTQCGTMNYIAPEMLGLSVQRTSSGGISEVPFLGGVTLEDISYNSRVTNGTFRGPVAIDLDCLVAFCRDETDLPLGALLNAGANGKAIDFIQRLLTPEPGRRIPANHALEDIWLTLDHTPDNTKEQLVSLGIDSVAAEDIIQRQDVILPGIISAILETQGTTPKRLASGAVSKGYTDLLEMLLRIFADEKDLALPNSTVRGWSFLQTAASEGHFGVAKLLLDWGANVNEEPSTRFGGRTALQAAIESGNTRLVKLLLARGANVHAKAAPKEGLTALQAAASGGFTDILEDLVKNYGAEVNEDLCELEGRTTLQAAAEYGDERAVEFLLRYGAKVNAEPSRHKGRTALQAAAGSGWLNIANLLLGRSADVNAKPCEDFGRTALQAAVEGGYFEMVELLLDNSADVNAEPSPTGGVTALWVAARENYVDIVKLLLERGALIDCDKCGTTACEIAKANGNLAIVEMLSEDDK